MSSYARPQVSIDDHSLREIFLNEHVLWIAVVNRAVCDAVRATGKRRHIARQWFRSRRTDAHSWLWVVDLMGLSGKTRRYIEEVAFGKIPFRDRCGTSLWRMF